tara:strand:+ start:1015 stop:1521 length:507 start_codon:yes stop_codon:yes gene_type:complete
MKQSQQLSLDHAQVMSLVMNNIITSGKEDRQKILNAREVIGADSKILIDALVNIKGLLSTSSHKKDSAVKARPDWESGFLFLIDNIEAGAIRTKAKKMIEDTVDGSKMDQDKLNLSNFALKIKSIKDEVIGYRKNLPSVTVRCETKILEDSVIEVLDNDENQDIIDMS